MQRISDADIARTSPPELDDLPPDFWDEAAVPGPKKAISWRVDQDVLECFSETGPRFQDRMNGVLRTYVVKMRQGQKREDPKRRTKRATKRLQLTAVQEFGQATAAAETQDVS